LERTWKKEVIALFEILSRHFYGKTEETTKIIDKDRLYRLHPVVLQTTEGA
jgi:hypothetical protein